MSEQEVDEGEPVVEVGGFLVGWGELAGADGERGAGSFVAFGVSHLGRQSAKGVKHGGGDEFVQAGETSADGQVERLFKPGQHLAVEGRVIEAGIGERDEFAPLIARAEHGGDQRFAIGEVAVAVEEDRAERLVERGVRPAEQRKRAAGGLGVEAQGVVGRGLSAATAGKNGQRGGDVRAD